ncbi:MAG: hypothetical protein HY362_02330 [Candidatus Aenigmarchaeota archaeon]|nr:hypothetical protein [Candidatus Aenigmarchaeota archaeon]
MNKLFCIVAATLFLLTIPTVSFALDPSIPDNNWRVFVSHAYGAINPGPDWNKLNYNDSSYVSVINGEGWTTKTSGTEPMGTTGSDSIYFRKWIDWSGQDLWLKSWDGYGGECFVNEQRVAEKHFYLSKYLKPGKNLIACYIIGPGMDGIMSTFYGNLITVSDNQIAWSNDWTDWYLTDRPVTTGTEGKYYYCYNGNCKETGFWASAWPWSTGGGTAFKKSIYLSSTNNSYLLVGSNVGTGGFWCSVNGDWTKPDSLVGFSQNTHEKYNLIADVSTKVKPGLNIVTCFISTYSEPNPYPKGFKKFDMNFVQLPVKSDITGLAEYSVPIDDATITALVSGSGNTTVYAELLKGTRSIDKIETDTVLAGTGTVKLTLDVSKDKAVQSSRNTWKYYVVNHLNPVPSSDWYKIGFDAESWGDTDMPTSAGGGPLFIRKILYLEKPIDIKLKAWEGYAGYCFVNENRVEGQNIQIGQYLRAGENVIACSIWGPGRDGITTTFYGEPVLPPTYTVLSNSFGDWFIVNSTESPILSLTEPKKYSVKITAVYNEYGISKSANYPIEFTETPIVLPITGNPFVQDTGSGGNTGTSSSSSSSAIPLALGLTAVGAVGAGYVALNGRKYGNSSAGPGERLKTFWNNIGKEEKYYNEIRLPEINKRQAEIESIIKGFQEQAKRKKEAEELEKVAQQVAWVNKLAGSGKLSTIEAAKEFRLLAGTAGIGAGASSALWQASSNLLEEQTVKPPKNNQSYLYSTSSTTAVYDPYLEQGPTSAEYLSSGINWFVNAMWDKFDWVTGKATGFAKDVYNTLKPLPLIGPLVSWAGPPVAGTVYWAYDTADNYIYANRNTIAGVSVGLSVTGIGFMVISMAAAPEAGAAAGPYGLAFDTSLFAIGAIATAAGGVIDVALGNSYLRRKERVEGTVLLISGFMSFIPSGAVERKGLEIIAENTLKQIGKEGSVRLVSRWGKYAEWAALYLKHNGRAVTEEEIEMLVKSRIGYLKTLNNPELNAKIAQLDTMDPFMTPARRKLLLEDVFESDMTINIIGNIDESILKGISNKYGHDVAELIRLDAKTMGRKLTEAEVNIHARSLNYLLKNGFQINEVERFLSNQMSSAERKVFLEKVKPLENTIEEIRNPAFTKTPDKIFGNVIIEEKAITKEGLIIRDVEDLMNELKGAREQLKPNEAAIGKAYNKPIYVTDGYHKIISYDARKGIWKANTNNFIADMRGFLEDTRAQHIDEIYITIKENNIEKTFRVFRGIRREVLSEVIV